MRSLVVLLAFIFVFLAFGSVNSNASTVEVIDLGFAKVSSSGISSPVTFSIQNDEQDVLSFEVIGVGNRNAHYIIDELSGPAGALVSPYPKGISISQSAREQNPFLGQYLSPNRVIPSLFPGVITALVPNNAKLSVLSGAYSVRVRVAYPKSVPPHMVRLYVLIKRVSVKSIDHGVLPVCFYFTGGKFSTSSYRGVGKAGTEFKAMYDVFEQIYLNAGIQIRVEAIADIRIRMPDDLSPELGSVFAQGKSRKCVSVFFGDTKWDALLAGATSQLPGPAFIDMKWGSGVFIRTNAALSDPDAIGTTLAHEVGHYLGLFHPVQPEFGRYGSDQLSDTLMMGSANVMATGSANASFSPQQREVLFRHPLVEIPE